MSNSNAKITNRKLVHDGYLKVESLTIQDGESETTKEFVTKKDAVVAIVVNSDNDTVVLTRQFRPVGEYVTEAVAGTIEAGEDPIQAIIREIEEEIGYKVPAERVSEVTNGYVSCGFTSEKYYKYIVDVTNDMKVNDGGGLKEEGENIEVVEMSVNDFVVTGSPEFDDKTQSFRFLIGYVITSQQLAEMEQLKNMQEQLQNMSEEDIQQMMSDIKQVD